WNKAVDRRLNADDQVKGVRQDIVDLTAERDRLRPGAAKLDEALREMKAAKKLLQKSEDDKQKQETRLKALHQDAQKLIATARQWEPFAKRAENLDKEVQLLSSRELDLQLRLGN